MAMWRSVIGRGWRPALVGCAVLVLATVLPVGATGASARELYQGVRGGDYLALGDSVAFGYVPANADPPPDYADAASFISYANYLSGFLHDHLTNASCPGETTASMLYPGAPSNGCENQPGSPYGYRSVYPLHVPYSGTQMAYALSFLASHRDTKLVTIDVGANDFFLCQETTADHCTSSSELQSVGHQVEANLTTILYELRYVAHYREALVVLDYYSINYSVAVDDAGAELLNSFINPEALQYGAVLADGYKAFQLASLASGGNPCQAGLLIPVPGGCNVHPTHLGHLVLAGAVLSALAGSPELRWVPGGGR